MARGTIITRTASDGKKRYDTVIRIGGKQRWKTFCHKKAAESYLDNNSSEVREGTYREIKKGTFKEYAIIWKQINLNDKMLKPATLNSYGSIIDHHLIPTFGDHYLPAITSDDISIFRTDLLTGGKGSHVLSAKSVRNILNLFNKILIDARKASRLKINPMADVDKPKIQKNKAGRALTYEEFNAVLAECSGRLRLIFLASCMTGMRRGETLGLSWDNIDFGNNAVKVRQELFWKHGKYQHVEDGQPKYVFTSPKSAESVRDIDLSPALRKELLEHRLKTGNSKGLVFCNSDGTPLDPNNLVKRDFADALKAADEKRIKAGLHPIGKLRWHDLRHTFGSWKIAQKEDVYYVQRQMGHSSIQITIDTYAHLLKNKNPEAAEKTDYLVFGG